MTDIVPTPADLRFGSDAEPGIRRRGTSRFTYVDERTGRPPGEPHLERIRALAVPPAWTDVWISADPTSHVQATGHDARGASNTAITPSSPGRGRTGSSLISSRSEHSSVGCAAGSVETSRPTSSPTHRSSPWSYDSST